MPRLQQYSDPIPDGCKWCYKCKEVQPLAEFNKRKQTVDGYHYACRSCINKDRANNRAAQKAAGIVPRNDQWNKENRGHLNKMRTAKRRETRDFIRSLKRGRPCDICGGIFPPTAMDWDHIDPALKSFEICQEGIREMYSQEKLLEEIAKCRLICANCHRIHSAIQRGEDPEEWGL